MQQFLAKYLSNKENQLIVHKNAGEIPVNKAAQNTAEVKNDQLLKLQFKWLNQATQFFNLNCHKCQSSGTTPAPLISGAYGGKIKPSQYKSKAC